VIEAASAAAADHWTQSGGGRLEVEKAATTATAQGRHATRKAQTAPNIGAQCVAMGGILALPGAPVNEGLHPLANCD